MKKNRLMLVGALLLCVLIPVSCIGIYRSTAETITITISEKERVSSKDSSQYLIWSEKGEVFSVEDTISFGVFNASDLYGKLKPGKKYKVRVAGWRIAFLSSYRNIIEIK